MRITTIICGLLLLLYWPASAAIDKQYAFVNPSPAREKSSWAFNFSSASPHCFASVHGLLQQWPNTFFPNGQTITPAVIPPFTKLYHGRRDGDEPPSPEWLAFDIEMSYGIMGSSRDSHMLTYQTTKSVNVIYFDGESAALMGSGQLDTQMLHIWGNTTGPPHDGNRFRGLFDEYARAIGLCTWIDENGLGGLGWGFEGIVRMNAGFELIWCNFTSPSLRLVSHLNVTAPQLPPRNDSQEIDRSDAEDIAALRAKPTTTSYYPLPPSPTRGDKATDPTNPAVPPNWRWDYDREPFLRSQTWGWFRSATQHYGSYGSRSGLGEHRVTILSCGILSYYAPKFTSQALARAAEEQRALNLTSDGLWTGLRDKKDENRTLELTQLMRRRREHVLGSITVSDAHTMRKDAERVLKDIVDGNQTHCSGMDWIAVTEEIIQVYAVDLISFRDVLSGKIVSSNYTAVKSWMTKVRDQTHTFLLPFLEYPSEADFVWSRTSDLGNDTFARCKYHHTRLLVPEESVMLGPEERLLKWAVEEVMGNICEIAVSVGFGAERIWQDDFNRNIENTSKWQWDSNKLAEAKIWKEGIEELMAWLGWADQWTMCPESCAWNEKCYIPMWPMIFQGRSQRGGRGPPPSPPPYHGGYGYGYPEYGRPGRGGRRPGFGMFDETDLWQPRCIDNELMFR